MVAQFSTVAYFYLNQEEIVKKHCENKSNPDMHCNGKCHLKKEIKSISIQQNIETEQVPSLKLNLLDFDKYFSEKEYLKNEISNSCAKTFYTSHDILKGHSAKFPPPPELI